MILPIGSKLTLLPLPYVSHRYISGVKILHINVIIYTVIFILTSIIVSHVFTLHFVIKKDQPSTYF